MRNHTADFGYISKKTIFKELLNFAIDDGEQRVLKMRALVRPSRPMETPEGPCVLSQCNTIAENGWT